MFEGAWQSLAGSKVAVLGHVRPDGDCIGSQVAFCRTLLASGIDAICVNRHEVPPVCRAFVGDTPFFQEDEADLQGRVAVTVDCADRGRLGPKLDALFPEIALNIDHHVSNTAYARVNVIEPHRSAAAEILADLFYGASLPIDRITAQALYIGIATDTGQFRYSSTTASTFDIVRLLIRDGADPAQAAFELYENERPEKLALLQRFLASFEYFCDGRFCVGTLRQADFTETGALKEDTEGLVDYARSVKGVEIGALLEERDGHIKGSLRAKDPIHRVDEIAKDFNGGGHPAAAGFNPGLPLEEFRPVFISRMVSHFDGKR